MECPKKVGKVMQEKKGKKLPNIPMSAKRKKKNG